MAESVLNKASKKGVEKTLVSVTLTESKEFNLEGNRFSLLRTTFDQDLGIKTIIDQRQATVSGNQFSGEAIDSMIDRVVSSTRAAQQDTGSGFAPSQGNHDFSFGGGVADEEWAFHCLEDLLKQREENFPAILIEGANFKFVKTKKILSSSDGTHLKSQQTHYDGNVMFTGKVGKQSSSFNYIGFQIPSDRGGKPFSLLEQGNLKELFRQTTEQIKTRKVPAKFDGEIIVTPYCMDDFIGGWSTFLGSAQMLKKSSFFENKLNELVASPKFTLSANPVDSNFASRKFWTSDGYLAQNETIFEKGVLRSYLLNHYAAQKMGRKVSLSEGSFLKMGNGDQSLQQMIGSIKKGLLLSRFSAGKPAENGDVSGVAKNSYYIENGEIQFPISETMISMNLSRLLLDIQAVSRETINTGYWELPWVRFSGVSVS